MTQLTQGNLSDLQAYLNNNDRAGFYMKYWELTGSEEALFQAQISTLNGFWGGAAEVANELVKTFDTVAGNYSYPAGGVEQFSLQIAQSTYNAIANDVNSGGTGVINDSTIMSFAEQEWVNNNLPGQFPGDADQFWDAAFSFDYSGVKENFTPGAAVGMVAVIWNMIAMGPSDLGQFLNGRYVTETRSYNGTERTVVLDSQTGKIVHVSALDGGTPTGLENLINASFIANTKLEEGAYAYFNGHLFQNQDGHLVKVSYPDFNPDADNQPFNADGTGPSVLVTQENGETVFRYFGDDSGVVRQIAEHLANTLFPTGMFDELGSKIFEFFKNKGFFDIETLDDLINQALAMFNNALVAPAPVRIDPLVLDLDGGGVTLTSSQNSSVYFDMDGNGMAERTGWVGSGEGLCWRWIGTITAQ